MNAEGKSIKSKDGKTGTVCRVEREYIHVKFPEEDEKQFGFPTAIEKGFLTFCDEAVQKQVLEAVKRERESPLHHVWMDKKPVTTPAARSVSSAVLEQKEEPRQVEIPKPAETFSRENFLQEEENLGTVEQIVEYLKNERGVECLVHFTPIENLSSILKHGIVPRDSDLLSEKERMSRVFPDEKELSDGSAWVEASATWSCFSVTRPNIWLLNKKRESREFVELYIDIRALEDLEIDHLLFYRANSATKENMNQMPKGKRSLERLFDEVVFEKRGRSAIRSETCVDENGGDISNWTTSSKAEIKTDCVVPAKYIRAIAVQCDSIKRKVERFVSENKETLADTVPVSVVSIDKLERWHPD